MSVAYDVIFSVIAVLPKVYPNFFDVPHSVLQQYEEKLRAPLMHTGTTSAYSLFKRPIKIVQVSVSTVIYSGRLFHADGPAQENALLPAVVSL